MAKSYRFYEFSVLKCNSNESATKGDNAMSKKIRTEAVDYLEIAEKTGASTATISRVNRSLNYGNDGYDMVFERIGLGEAKEEKAE